MQPIPKSLTKLSKEQQRILHSKRVTNKNNKKDHVEIAKTSIDLTQENLKSPNKASKLLINNNKTRQRMDQISKIYKIRTSLKKNQRTDNPKNHPKAHKNKKLKSQKQKTNSSKDCKLFKRKIMIWQTVKTFEF